MANQHFSTNLQQEVTCPVCLEIPQDPVPIGCGHNFCHGCITQLKETSGEFFKCSLCNSSMKNDAYVPSWQLENLAERIQSLDPSEMQLREEQLRCPTHGKVIQYYCKADGKLLCVVCCDSKEHEFHKTSRVEEAAQHYQEQIRRHVEVLEQKEMVLVHMKAQGEEKISNFMALVASEEQRIHREFKYHQQILEDEKNLLLSYTQWLEEKGNRECKCYIIATRAQLNLLKDLKDSLKAKQQMPPVELLQDIKGTLQRCEAMQFQFHSLPVIPLDLEIKVSKAKSRHNSIIKSMWKFGDYLQTNRKKYHGRIIQDMSTTQRQSKFLLEKSNPNSDRSSQPGPGTTGDPTTNPGCSTPHSTAQFQPQIGAKFEIKESGLELRLPPVGAPGNAAEMNTTDTCSRQGPSSSIEL